MFKTSTEALIAFLLLFTSTSFAQTKQLQIEKEPMWVTVNNIDYSRNKLESEAEDGYMDVGFEKQASVAHQAQYYRKVFKILSEAGVQNCSEISIEFDPTYQRLVLHSIKIIRDGSTINKLQLAKFKTIQQESDLKRHLYNGTLTALLLLDDVRKGDIIDYSYSIKGSNPILNGKYSDALNVGFSVPVAHLYYKVVTPATQQVFIKNTATDIQATTKQTTYGVEYEWKLTNLAPMRIDSRIPSWYDPYPTIFLSQYNSWSDVNKWAMNLFPEKVQLSPELQKKIEHIKTSHATNEARTLAALHFVQDDIRYMGIEMGVSSHKPGNPNKIAAQRFGDCKDKSYLLCTMLRALGIEANPVFINTSFKKTLLDWLPTPTAFDHVTVRAVVDKNVYYLDPTISKQRGSLSDVFYPDYQVGLVIKDSTKALTVIPFQQKGMVSVYEVFTIPDMTGDAKLKVITNYTGSYADDVRYTFDNNSLYELKTKYRDFYAAYFDKVVADSIAFSDDGLSGEFVTTEYYSINNIWKTEKGKIKSKVFAPYVINSLLSKPNDAGRKMPFHLSYPIRYTEDVEINLPEDWYFDIEDKDIKCPGFRFRSAATFSGKRILLHYDYEVLKDHVLPAESAEYVAAIEKAEEVAGGWELTYSNGISSSSYARPLITAESPGSIFPKLYLLLGICVLVTFLYKQNKKRTQY